MLPEVIVLENLTMEVRKLNIRSGLKWKGAIPPDFGSPPTKILGDDILGQFDNIISQFRQRSKRWQLSTAVRLDHHLTWDLDQSLNLTPNPLVLLQIIFPSNSILLWDKGL